MPLLYLVPLIPILVCSAMLLRHRPLRAIQRGLGLRPA
jgi:hypothetical protein